MTKTQSIKFAEFCKQHQINPSKAMDAFTRLDYASRRLLDHQRDPSDQKRTRMQSSALKAWRLLADIGLDAQWDVIGETPHILHTGLYTIKCNGFIMPCKTFLNNAKI